MLSNNLKTIGPSNVIDLIRGTKGLINEPSLPLSAYFSSAVINFASLALPLTILHIYDRVLPNRSFDTLAVLITGLAVVLTIDATLRIARGAIMSWHAGSFAHRQSLDAMARLMASHSATTSAARASSIIAQLRSLSDLSDFHGSPSRLLLIDLACIPLFAIVMAIIAGPLIFVQLALLVVFFAFITTRTKKLRAIIGKKEDFEERKYDFILETLQTMPTLKSHAMEPLLMRRFERLQSSSSLELKQNVVLSQTISEAGNLLAMLMTLGIVFFGALMAIAGDLTIGALAACMLLSSQMLQPILRSLTSWNVVAQNTRRREEVTKLYDQIKDQEPKVETVIRRQAKFNPARIQVRNVAVQFGDNRPVFQNANIDVAPGQFVGLKGADGSGRSVLMKCIFGQITPSAGQVLINGQVASEQNSSISYVGQTPQLFQGSILDNLTLFGTYTVDDAKWVADVSGLTGQISQLPDGFDTQLLGSASTDLSAAFAQLICIARAVVSKPSILLLDDANSGLDAKSEVAFIKMLNTLRGDVSIFMTTQRPSILRNADLVYQLANETTSPVNPDTLNYDGYAKAQARAS